VCAGSLALASLLALGFPTLSSAAESSPSVRLAPPTSPLERALTGGLVTLREPATDFVRLTELELDIGSTLPEVLQAAADCAREPLAEQCGDNEFANEAPQRRVRVAPFFLSRSEVSVAEYDRCVHAGGCTAAGYVSAPRFQRPNLPASFVDFEQARAYCRFRGLRLPSEAEFERAARGAPRRRYPWGQLFNRRLANHGRLGLDRSDDVDGFSELAPVGSFPDGRTPEGILDLAGNVAEWSSGAYSETPGSPPITGLRVLRGGDYMSAAPWLRAAARVPERPERRAPFIGFRCARSARVAKRAEPDATSL
jgi:formylglycine-generating enzyme required for sulfatase activity